MFSVDCKWGTWSTWTACPSECGNDQTRTREKNPEDSNGGNPCTGDPTEQQSCNNPCPGKNIPRESPSGYFIVCIKPNFVAQLEILTLLLLTVNCLWADWTSWTGCKVSAVGDCGMTGKGQTGRTRQISVEEMHGGTECEADSLEELRECCSLTPTDGSSFTCPPTPTCSGIIFMG